MEVGFSSAGPCAWLGGEGPEELAAGATVACNASASMRNGTQSGLATRATATSRSPTTQRAVAASRALASRRRRASNGENVKTAAGCGDDEDVEGLERMHSLIDAYGGAITTTAPAN